MRYLLLMVLATVLVFAGCGDDDSECYQGDFEIHTADDMAELESYMCVDGNLTIMCTELISLNLPNLVSVNGYFAIWGNNSLTNLDGLSALTSVGALRIYQNDALANLDGLSALTSVGEDLQIRYNGALTNLDGLSALTSVSDEFWIHYNDILPDCEACDLLDQLTTASTSIEVLANLDDDCTPVPTNCP